MKKLKFGKDLGTEFYHELTHRVQLELASSESGRYANRRMIMKVGFYLLSFIVLYTLLLSTSFNLVLFYILYLAMGLNVLFIGFNISHDAAHNAIFKSRKLNEMLYFISFNLQGNNGYIWKKYHIESHHVYTNVYGSDIDVVKNPLLRMTKAQPHRPWHKYQYIYAPFLYLFYSINWFFVRDLLLVFRKSARTINLGKIPNKEIAILVVNKLLYLTYMVVIPVIVLPFGLVPVLIAFILNHFMVSLVFCGVLGCSHLADETYHYTEADESRVDDSWATLQLRTSLDYNADSPLANFFLGGFNAHTLHHLFPNICHIHYLKMVPILRQTAKEYGLTYNEAPYSHAIRSHFKFLRKMGAGE